MRCSKWRPIAMPLIGELGDHYGECAVPRWPTHCSRAVRCIRCAVLASKRTALALVRFADRADRRHFDGGAGTARAPGGGPRVRRMQPARSAAGA